MSLMRRKLLVSGVAALVAFCVGAAVACEDIAVVSEDARYVVLSGDDLAEKDVGNLWWLAIRSAGASARGSTLATAALHARFYDRDTGNIILPPDRGGTVIIIHQLGRDLRVASDLVAAEPQTLYSAWWLDNRRNDRLVDRELFIEEAKTVITLLDPDMNQLGQWDVHDMSAGGFGVGCEDADGRIIIAGLTARLVIDGETAELEQLERADRSAGYRMSDISLGCKALLVQLDQADDEKLKTALIDLAENRIESEFVTTRYNRWLMFAEGRRLLQHVMSVEEVPGGIRLHPTTRCEYSTRMMKRYCRTESCLPRAISHRRWRVRRVCSAGTRRSASSCRREACST